MSYPETRHLLSERTNPHSAVRANGVRFWGYPARTGGIGAITCIVAHTTENDPGPGVALNVARWQASTAPAPSSYHVLVDTRDVVRTLEDRAVAFHAVGMNTRGLGLSFATRAARWGQNTTADRAMVARGAWVAARWCRLYGIPVRWLTKAEADRGVKGFIRHSTADPGRRGDPGGGFPSSEFFDLVRGFLSDPATVTPPPAAPEEDDDMTPEQLDRILSAIATGPARAGRATQADAVWGRTDPNYGGMKADFTLRQIARGVSAIAADVASLDPVGLTDAQVEGLAHAIADGLDERVARRVVDILAARIARTG